MPESYTIDKERRLVLSTARGALSFHDASEHLSQLEKDADFAAEYGHLFDFTEVARFSLDANDIKMLAGRRVFSASPRRAFVAPSDLAYGLARQLESYFDMAGVPNARAFRDRPEALRWLTSGDANERQPKHGFSPHA